MAKMIRKLADKVTKACAPYEVRCNYGTKQKAWTIKQALEWVSVSGEVAVIIHRLSGELVASRNAY